MAGQADTHAGFSLHVPLVHTVDLGEQQVQLRPAGADHVTCIIDDTEVTAERRGAVWWFDGTKARAQHVQGRTVTLFGAAPLAFTMPDPLDRASTVAAGDAVLSPMPGLVSNVAVQVGDTVSQGDPLATLEAMKMEHILRAPRDGIVAAIHAQAGAQVEAGIVLVALEEEE